MLFRITVVLVFIFIQKTVLHAQQASIDSLEARLRIAKNDTSKVTLLNQLVTKYQFADPARAKTYAVQSIQLAEELDYPIGLASAYRLLGVLNVDQSNFDTARLLYDKAMAIVKGKTDPRSVRIHAMLQHNIGVIYHYREAYDTAVNYYLLAARYYNEIGEESLLFNTYNNLSHIYALMHDRNNGLKYASQALILSERIKDSTKIGFAGIGLASAKLELKQYNGVQELLNRAIRIGRETDNHYMIGKAYRLVGQLEMEGHKNYRRSLVWLQQSLDAMQKSGNEYEIAAAYHALGENYSKNGEHVKAKEALQNALTIGQKLGLQQIEQYVLHNLAEVEALTGNFKAAYRHLSDYIKVNDSLTNKANQKEVNALETKYRTEIKEYKIGELEREKKIQTLSLREKSTINYILIGSLCVLLMLFVLGYRNFRTRELLAKQQKELDQQRIRELEKDRQLVAVDSMLKGQEEERSRLAKDLHDGLGGMLSGVKYSLVNMKENSNISHEQLMVFDKSLLMLDTSISELRRVAQNMMPEALAKFGLDEALKDYCSAFQSSTQLKVQYQSFGLEQRLDAGTEIILYRIVQELLNNAMKHSKATEVLVQAIRTDNRVSITVEDNGKGFDRTALEKNKGAGWSNIRTRVDYLKGKLEMDTHPGQGTSVNIEVTV